MQPQSGEQTDTGTDKQRNNKQMVKLRDTHPRHANKWLHREIANRNRSGGEKGCGRCRSLHIQRQQQLIFCMLSPRQVIAEIQASIAKDQQSLKEQIERSYTRKVDEEDCMPHCVLLTSMFALSCDAVLAVSTLPALVSTPWSWSCKWRYGRSQTLVV